MAKPSAPALLTYQQIDDQTKAVKQIIAQFTESFEALQKSCRVPDDFSPDEILAAGVFCEDYELAAFRKMIEHFHLIDDLRTLILQLKLCLQSSVEFLRSHKIVTVERPVRKTVTSRMRQRSTLLDSER